MLRITVGSVCTIKVTKAADNQTALSLFIVVLAWKPTLCDCAHGMFQRRMGVGIGLS